MNAAPGTQAAPAQTVWDVGGADFAGQQMPPDHEFSELVEVDTSKGGKGRGALIAVLVLVLGCAGWWAYEQFVAERDPMATLTGYFDLLTGGQSAPDETLAPMPTPRPKKAVAKAAPKAKAPKASSGPKKLAVEGNPYWTLPNKILGSRAPMQRPWAPEEEETLRAGLSHHFAYQRYKTVMDVRKKRLIGSDAVLWDALQDKKYWTRMFAAVGLAEFNVEISLQSLEGAMNGARSELVADFFERFVHRPSGAELFVMRQALRLLDEKGRLVVLHAIARSHDELADLYLMAATKDPGAKVQAWIGKALAHRKIPEAKQAELLAIVDGRTDPGYLFTHGKAPKPAPAAALGIATEADLEKELKEFQTSDGDVEFYDEPVDDGAAAKDAAGPSDEEDPDTFEYDE